MAKKKRISPDSDDIVSGLEEVVLGLQGTIRSDERMEERVNGLKREFKECVGVLDARTNERYGVISQKAQNVADMLKDQQKQINEIEKDSSKFQIKLTGLNKTVEANAKQNEECRKNTGKLGENDLIVAGVKKDIKDLTKKLDDHLTEAAKDTKEVLKERNKFWITMVTIIISGIIVAVILAKMGFK